MSDITLTSQPTWEDAPASVAFIFGHGETFVGHWFVEGHALVKLAKAVEPMEPGTVVTGQDVATDPEVPAVFLMFEDEEALRRMGEYLLQVAADLAAGAA